jgi:glycosyltransferase involved in cell wall biosynthesis
VRVVLDARPLSHPQSGGFRSYVRGLVQGLVGIPDLEAILYLDREVNPNSLPPGFQTRILSPDRLKTDLALFAKQVRQDAPDLVHGTMNYAPETGGVPFVVTLHDAMGLKRYAWETKVRRSPREWAMNRYWWLQTKLSVLRARRIVTVSQAAARELASVLGSREEKFRVVYNGIQLPPPTPGIVRTENTVLAIASPDPRKNLDALYIALTEYRKAFGASPPRLDVVCTSATTAIRAETALQERGLTDFRLLKSLDDQALSDAYASTAVFAWPSRLEGFGMPPVEAMQAGTPVVSSLADPMPEVLGSLPVFFDPASPQELATSLAALLQSPDECGKRGVEGREWAARYSCEAQGQGTWAAWSDALGGLN